MERVTVSVHPPYDVLLGDGLLRQAGALIRPVARGNRALLVSDSNVAPLYLPAVQQSLKNAGFFVTPFVFPSGEASKRLATVEDALCTAAEAGLTRADLMIALGGGVTGDLTGLAAALYLRGVDFVQLPTTLLAMADASVGGKTAVNLAAGKNLCGAFWQPRRVLCDLCALNTLPPAIAAEGMAEVIKTGAIASEALLDGIARGEGTEKAIAACLRVKAALVSRDPRDDGPRQLLNLGHTFGHALEKLSGYGLYHGEAVAVGLLIAAFTAERHGLCAPGVYAELRALLTAHNLPVSTPFTAAQIAENARGDKKRRGDTLTLVLPEARGKSRLYPLPAAELAAFIACCDGEVTAK